MDGVPLVEFVVISRPSVSGDGSVAVFVTSSYDVGIVNTAPPYNYRALGVAGRVHSVAMSPDGTRFAFVARDPTTGQADNEIALVDLFHNTNRVFKLLAPVPDGDPQDSVLFADSMVFTADSGELIYDTLSQVHFNNGPTVQRWSISKINLSTETQTTLMPPVEGYDTGNPFIGRSGNRYLAFDVGELATGNNYIAVADLFSGDIGTVGTVGHLAVGYPSFTGDESAVVYAAQDPSASQTGFSLVGQQLSADRLKPSGQPTLWLPDAWIGVIYRRGVYSGSNALPNVAITSPTDQATFPAPTSISISANAIDPDGSISKVEFYQGSNKLGEDTTPPYQFTWSNVSAGTYRLSARAIDNLGGTADSAAVNVVVGQEGVAPQFTAQPHDVALSVGQNAIFSAQATGTPAPTLCWQQSTDGGSTWSDLSDGAGTSGSTTSTLTLAGVTTGMSGQRFRLAASNTAGTVFSQAATLTVNTTTTSFVQRQLPSGYVPGAVLTVGLQANPPPARASYTISDQPPAGWTVGTTSSGGAYDAVNHLVKFGPFFDAQIRTLTYQVTPPQGESGSKTFTGNASADGASSPISGDSSIDSVTLHPADNNPADSRIIDSELTAYGAAWKRGDAWPVAPNPIPDDYVTRAGYLWRNGEGYTIDPNVAGPPLWWVPDVPHLLGGGIHKMDLGDSTAVSQLPATYSPSVPFTVTITTTPDPSVFAQTISDQPPAGWAVSGITEGGTLDPATGRIKWGPIL